MTSSNDHVHVVATLHARPEAVAQLAEVLDELARTSRKSPGNLRFDIQQQLSDPTQFVAIEHWDGVAAVDGHMTSPHVGVVLARLAPLLAAPPQIVRYKQLG